MDVVNKSKIDAIYPLSTTQQSLLFHHLAGKEDEGFLHVQCTINTRIEPNALEAAWNEVIKVHEVLRSTIHWEGLENPLRIVHSHKKVHLTYHDWSQLTTEEVDIELNAFKKQQKELGFQFQKDPLLNMFLFTLEENKYLFLWPTHHLLIDGWSCQVLLNEMLRYLNAILTNTTPDRAAIPSHSDYLAVLKQSDTASGKKFWNNYFDGKKVSNLVDPKNLSLSDSALVTTKLSEEKTISLQKYAAGMQITISTLFQGIWAIVISKLLNSEDVTFGITVSGRAVDLPNMHLVSGMYMNVHPIRIVIKPQSPIRDWFREIQQQQHEARRYDHLSLDDILSFLENDKLGILFDTLMVFENYPNATYSEGYSQISDFQSGLTSTYPLTFTAIPGKELELSLSIKTSAISKDEAHVILNSLVELLEILPSRDLHTVSGIVELDLYWPSLEDGNETLREVADKQDIGPPRNETELKLLQIWESIFGRVGIGIDDNFFKLGGNSIMAVRLISSLNTKFNTRFLPTIILQHPTIEQLASSLGNADTRGIEAFKNLVPLRAKGDLSPLFCLHAGGGHVFFYRPLANHLNPDRPVYAIQPSGLYGKEKMHSSISEMAKDYVSQIVKAVPDGPYNLLTYCFSTAVGLEIAYLLKAKGKKVNVIIMDSLVQQQSLQKERLLVRSRGFFKRLLKNPLEAIKTMIGDRVELFLQPLWVRAFGTEERRQISKVQSNLIKLYKQYSWPKNNADISLLLTKKTDESFNMEALKSWEEITNQPVKVLYIQGSHRTIFNTPDVKYAAEAVENCCQ